MLYLIQGLPGSAKGREVWAFFSLFGRVATLNRDTVRMGNDSADWLLEMETEEGSRSVLLLNGEGYAATAARKRQGPMVQTAINRIKKRRERVKAKKTDGHGAI